MSNAPITHIDLAEFTADPYPILASMRAKTPITFVPELAATLMVKRDDIHVHEKRTQVFSSVQPDGLMVQLMGENMMRKDGEAHMAERRALFPALSPRTVNDHWKAIFETATLDLLGKLRKKGKCDLVRDYAMPVSAMALKAITGLESMSDAEMDGVSQAMIDGCANYAGDPKLTKRCNRATALIDEHIKYARQAPPQFSALQVMQDAGLPDDSQSANTKLIISGGQNEPRDAIAGTIWALLNHPSQLAMIQDGRATYGDAFSEYARWMAPIGMSPRRIAQTDTIDDITFDPEDRVFFMFGSAGRDEDHFSAPDTFDVTRNTQSAISFGAGPHFCAGAAAARCLIADVALPLAFAHLPNLRLTGPVPYTGWAFRGPTKMPVAWEI
ncbi:MAG: cytochrome P450 [Ascidiaceihabitans sp.]|nr:cytochrome P450 [Ascidiaceihabitans sp.]